MADEIMCNKAVGSNNTRRNVRPGFAEDVYGSGSRSNSQQQQSTTSLGSYTDSGVNCDRDDSSSNDLCVSALANVDLHSCQS
uniref:Uncharacterized protein n=1 Tax=Ditylenchus dipsaci TaxID=166011 RepID=A0A915D0Q0_9BILA